MTSNTAEYSGLILGLNACLRFLEGEALAGVKVTSLTVRGDSSLVINQVNGKWKANQTHLEERRDVARGLLDRIEMKLAEAGGGEGGREGRRVNLAWVERAENSKADALANRAMDSKVGNSLVVDDWVRCRCLGGQTWTGGIWKKRGVEGGAGGGSAAEEGRFEPPPKRTRKETVVAEAYV